MDHFCPVCGNILEDDFSHYYVICSCCGNQGNVDDDIDKIHLIKQDEEHYWDVLAKLKNLTDNSEEVPKEISDYLASMRYTKEEAWQMLREEWIKKGYPWVHGGKPINWNEKMAKKQLENINVHLD
jgi:hypothetical protein